MPISIYAQVFASSTISTHRILQTQFFLRRHVCWTACQSAVLSNHTLMCQRIMLSSTAEVPGMLQTTLTCDHVMQVVCQANHHQRLKHRPQQYHGTSCCQRARAGRWDLTSGRTTLAAFQHCLVEMTGAWLLADMSMMTLLR